MCDAAIFSDLGKNGAVVVALNADGHCVVACQEATIGRPIPEMAEALALRRADYLAREQGCQSVIFTSDCLSLVQRVNSPTRDRSLVGSVVSDIKVGASGFASVVFKHFHRQSNVLAHVLAKSCMNSSGLCFSFYSGLYPGDSS